jgi:hypothetical protein
LPSNGRSGGILCGFKIEKFDIEEMKKHLRMGTMKKEQFLVELSNICSKNNLPMLVGGDFNILRFSSEKIKHSAPTDILICSTGLLILMD